MQILYLFKKLAQTLIIYRVSPGSRNTQKQPKPQGCSALFWLFLKFRTPDETFKPIFEL